MVSIRKKKLTIRRLLSHLDDLDPNVIFGNAVSDRQENVVNEGTVDQESTASEFGDAISVNVKFLGRCFLKRIHRGRVNIVHTVGNRIQNAILTAIVTFLLLKLN